MKRCRNAHARTQKGVSYGGKASSSRVDTFAERIASRHSLRGTGAQKSVWNRSGTRSGLDGGHGGMNAWCVVRRRRFFGVFLFHKHSKIGRRRHSVTIDHQPSRGLQLFIPNFFYFFFFHLFVPIYHISCIYRLSRDDLMNSIRLFSTQCFSVFFFFYYYWSITLKSLNIFFNFEFKFYYIVL